MMYDVNEGRIFLWLSYHQTKL